MDFSDINTSSYLKGKQPEALSQEELNHIKFNVEKDIFERIKKDVGNLEWVLCTEGVDINVLNNYRSIAIPDIVESLDFYKQILQMDSQSFWNEVQSQQKPDEQIESSK